MSDAMPMKRPTVEQLWRSYVQAVYPQGMAPDQHDECRRAFYAAIKGWIDLNMAVLDPDAEPTDDDLRWMDDIYDELEAFGSDEFLQMLEPAGKA